MSPPRPHRLVRRAVASACMAALVAQAAHAAPPLSRLVTPLSHASDAKAAPATTLRVPQSRLDLAAPSLNLSVFERPAAVFPTTPRRTLGIDSSASLPALGSGPPVRLMSRPEMLARNFKREGLPLARLFQSENALVHVGLSPKGKPGLWFVEKLH